MSGHLTKIEIVGVGVVARKIGDRVAFAVISLTDFQLVIVCVAYLRGRNEAYESGEGSRDGQT